MNKSSSIKIAGILIALSIIFAWMLFLGRAQDVENISTIHPGASAIAQIGEKEIVVELATTAEQRERGLSGRATLSSDTGMLFVFPEPLIPSFWMPDMHFPIDIIWIGEGKVIGVEEYVSNEFDSLHPVYYRPPVPIDHVLEVNAGFAEKNNIEVNDTFSLINSQVNGAPVTEVNATSTVEANNGSVKTFVVEASNFKFSMPEIRVDEGDTVRITFKNTQGFHDLVIDEFNAGTKKIQAGQEDTIEFTANKTGVFEYYCSVGSHRAMGMAGKLIVE